MNGCAHGLAFKIAWGPPIRGVSPAVRLWRPSLVGIWTTRGEVRSVKKATLNLDAIIVLVIVFAVSFGFNLYQRYQYRDLLQAKVDADWHAQNMKSSWIYTKGQLAACRASEPNERPAN